MESAKNAVKSFIGKAGHHDTTVDESVNPAVTNETIKPHRHEESTQAIDREVHQDHYHTTVQPIAHKEVLPEQHSHQQAPVQEREFRHGDSDKVRSAVEREAAQFGNTSRTHNTTHSASQGAAVTGEHVHHHVHETVQPVIHKETVQPEVVHTTVPIHEVHHAQGEHHGISTLPTKTLDEFKSVGGSIAGGSQRQEAYEGHPRPYNPSMQGTRSAADIAPSKHDGLHGNHGNTSTRDANVSDVNTASTGTGNIGSHGNIGTRNVNVSDVNTPSTGTGNTGSIGTASVSRQHGTGYSGTAGKHAIGSSDNNTSQSYGQDTSSTGGNTTRSVNPTDTSASNTTDSRTHGHADSNKSAVDDDVQHASRQGKDPDLVENKSSGKWVGDGVDGSHSAVFGLTKDGHKHTDTSHGSSSLKPAHSKDTSNNSSTTGSREVTGSGVADQMHDPRVAEKAHGGSAMSSTGSAKPGAGAPGGEQGLGEVRPHEHGSQSKMADKIDPTTDADGDGKRGVMD